MVSICPTLAINYRPDGGLPHDGAPVTATDQLGNDRITATCVT
ncbi:hypothetical protein I553_9365 [Mycobacterium xenopi 4042]|uniref:Uncharacterized protein n=1 Tax=Mycobacterium xenopi 4042 TaxID=1299334 RepID=X8DXT9_MYCXE|nr:hypothetical protein I553_9365 [Mycobacterium xenopi 4042]